MIGVAGRNFGSKLLVNAQIACAGVPMTLALFLYGDTYHAVLGCVLVPFFISLKSIADRLRRTLLDAVVATRDVTLLARRFDTALNNMPHGLCMFDPQRRLVVSNKRVEEILASAAVRRGASLRELLARLRQVRHAERSHHGAAARGARQSSVRKFDGELAVATEDGRALSLTFEPMENGGSVVLVEDVTERKNAEAKINHLARYDALTGLPNRTFFHDQMDGRWRTMKRGTHVRCAVRRSRQFKQVNDTLGHPAGDALLCAVAERLRGIIRDTDLVARFGGDEFVVLQTPVPRAEEAAALAGRIVEDAGRALRHRRPPGDHRREHRHRGCAARRHRCRPAAARTPTWRSIAPSPKGAAIWRFFEPEMDVKARARRSLELDLRQARRDRRVRGPLPAADRPEERRIIDLRGAAALAASRARHGLAGRVHSDRRGDGPDRRDRQLGAARACRDCAQWPGEITSPSTCRRSSSAAATDARHQRGAGGVRPARRTGSRSRSPNPCCSRIPRSRARSCSELREFGVRISLDDFGTGYSSLSYLHNFPLAQGEDRSLVPAGVGCERAALPLLRNVARLIAELGMSVTMEGVETREQLDLIVNEGTFDEAQGFLFSPAVRPQEILAFLDPTSLKQWFQQPSRKVA